MRSVLANQAGRRSGETALVMVTAPDASTDRVLGGTN